MWLTPKNMPPACITMPTSVTLDQTACTLCTLVGYQINLGAIGPYTLGWGPDLPHPVCYHAKFGRSMQKAVGTNRVPPKFGCSGALTTYKCYIPPFALPYRI